VVVQAFTTTRPRHQLTELYPALSLLHTHIHMCTCVYISRRLDIFREIRGRFSRERRRGTTSLSNIAQPSVERARPEMICEVLREFIRLADKRKATIRILMYDHVAIVCLGYLLNGGS